VAKALSGVLRFGHVSQHHADQVWPYLRRIEAGEDITAVVVEAYEVVEGQDEAPPEAGTNRVTIDSGG